MPITINKNKAKTKVNEALPLSDHADLIDTVGTEAAALATLEAKIKALTAEAKPLVERRKKLLDLLTQEAIADEIGDDDKPVMRGNAYEVELGARSSTRVITDIEQLKGCMGDEAFMSCATVTMTNVDQYTSKMEQVTFIDLQRGKREGKVNKRVE